MAVGRLVLVAVLTSGVGVFTSGNVGVGEAASGVIEVVVGCAVSVGISSTVPVAVAGRRVARSVGVTITPVALVAVAVSAPKAVGTLVGLLVTVAPEISTGAVFVGVPPPATSVGVVVISSEGARDPVGVGVGVGGSIWETGGATSTTGATVTAPRRPTGVISRRATSVSRMFGRFGSRAA